MLNDEEIGRGMLLMHDIRMTSPDHIVPDMEHSGIKIKELPAIPPGDNPYWHDSYNMGANINKDMEAMFSSCGNYIILIFRSTGRRIHLSFDETFIKKG